MRVCVPKTFLWQRNIYARVCVCVCVMYVCVCVRACVRACVCVCNTPSDTVQLV